jgi:formylglycine-generating enzyme required for sulfatase activity
VSKERLEQALKNWQAKLADCEHELSIVTDTSRKFELKKNIEECKENIDRIKNSLKSDFTELTPTTPKSQSPQAEYIEFDLDAGGKLELVYIPAGSFVMGQTDAEERQLIVEAGGENYKKYYASERPQHLVNVSAFYMGKYPITQRQYLAVMGANPSCFQGVRLPVENVSWHDAQSFCQKLSRKTRKKIRLPSEAQWEYACRAETSTPFHFGEIITTDLVNFEGNYTYGNAPKGKYLGKTTPVGLYQVANNFGLDDMHGNVWEWCLDHFHENYQGAPQNGGAWIDKNDSDTRVLRGGSWGIDPRSCRSATRFFNPPDNRFNFIGFRVLCEIPKTL